MRHAMTLPLVAAAVLAAACDEKPAPPKPSAPSATASATASAPPAPEPPKTTTLSLDDRALSVNGDEVRFDAPDVRGRLAAALGSAPKIAGEAVVLPVLRPTKASKVALVLAVLRGAKAASVTVKSQRRDKAMADLGVAFDAPPACAGAAYIGKDVSISVWTAGGTVAKRYAKGMAGPDITLGSEGLRKAVAACDSTVAVLGADESITWGLLFDLALATKEGTDDKRVAAVRFTVPVEAPVPGRKVTP